MVTQDSAGASLASHYHHGAAAQVGVRMMDARAASTPMVRDVAAARAPMAPGQVPISYTTAPNSF